MSRLAVTSLALSHFRSHKRAALEVDPRPVAIFGPNGAGKTNLLEAVSILSPGRGLRRASAEEMTRRPEALGWKVTAEIAAERPHEIETWSEGGAARAVRIDGKTAPQIALGRIVRVLWLIPSMDRLWIEGAEGRRRFLDRAVLSFDPDHAQVTLDYEKAMRERNRLLKHEIRDPHWYGVLEARMAAAGARIHAARLDTLRALSEAQEGAETAFPTATLALEQSEGPLPGTEADLKEGFAEGRGRDMAAGRTLTGPHRTDLSAIYAAKDVPAKDCSTGEQKALLVSLILANARALADRIGAPPLLLLDEVSAHLDAGRRAALYDEIAALGTQAWMTGTGPELFEELGARAQRIEVTESGGVSEVARR
ncbi:DNA replication/repair protein RecF [Histidinibacterium aquaticum]|uniref:DNA replication and repair protein RecF n=1 Tax=Histidinibacterium aquaticum TaxID=2613962 RepID=A0A5J5GFC8_9RHOB|nr:DNA replication/repair protein RecF [Histidinibacterium aquaticum]KAA9006720.1 DNA replication/repair protein RecF [Histidinibacterium aquaticum]